MAKQHDRHPSSIKNKTFQKYLVTRDGKQRFPGRSVVSVNCGLAHPLRFFFFYISISVSVWKTRHDVVVEKVCDALSALQPLLQFLSLSSHNPEVHLRALIRCSGKSVALALWRRRLPRAWGGAHQSRWIGCTASGGFLEYRLDRSDRYRSVWLRLAFLPRPYAPGLKVTLFL